MDRESLLLLWVAPMLDRRYTVLLCSCLDKVGRAVIVEEDVNVSMEIVVVGVPSLVRGRNVAPFPLMVSCEGRDFRV